AAAGARAEPVQQIQAVMRPQAQPLQPDPDRAAVYAERFAAYRELHGHVSRALGPLQTHAAPVPAGA
ncbi:MAG: hypothetical protein ACOCXJ_06480, partial [Planctomycetota bacterium]